MTKSEFAGVVNLLDSCTTWRADKACKRNIESGRKIVVWQDVNVSMTILEPRPSLSLEQRDSAMAHAGFSKCGGFSDLTCAHRQHPINFQHPMNIQHPINFPTFYEINSQYRKMKTTDSMIHNIIMS